jgi:hypothetical protein
MRFLTCVGQYGATSVIQRSKRTDTGPRHEGNAPADAMSFTAAVFMAKANHENSSEHEQV